MILEVLLMIWHCTPGQLQNDEVLVVEYGRLLVLSDEDLKESKETASFGGVVRWRRCDGEV